uniref:Uncharacterized protein n=1 Tax=Siphoviridae sp. ctLNL10 TaxID=2825453 RepID=A0A8S5Q4T6_9CAUD|nr:MAG TPA: hypothetical protein [Siphoviridae sp. ctLNL10]
MVKIKKLSMYAHLITYLFIIDILYNLLYILYE